MAAITWTDVDVSSADTNAFTFTATVGSGDGGRTFFPCSHARRNSAVARDISSVTVDGVAATLVKKEGDFSGATQPSIAGIHMIAASALPDPSATSVSVVVTYTGAMNRGFACAMAVTADAINTTPHATNSAKDTDSGGGPETLTLDLNAPAGGFVIAIGGGYGEASSTRTWSGLTEQHDTSSQSLTRFSTAYANAVSAETPRAVSLTVNDANPFNVGLSCAVAAAFAPAAATVSPRSYGAVIG